MATKTKNTKKQCLGDLAEAWARKNKIPYPKGIENRTMSNPEYLAMYNLWPGFDDNSFIIPPRA